VTNVEITVEPRAAHPDEDDGDDQYRHVYVTISEPDGTSRTGSACTPINPNPDLDTLATAVLLVEAVRGAAAAWSPRCHELVAANTPHLAGREARIRRGQLTVAVLDEMVAAAANDNGDVPDRLKFPDCDEPIPYRMVRAVLIAAGAIQ
jgi:hypothetical protein